MARRADAERNRQAILEAALHALARNPDAALDDIARAAGVTRTTVYRHFPNREAVVSAVYLEALAAVSAAMVAAQLDEGPVPDAVRRAVDAVIGVADEYAVLVNGPATDLNEPRLVAGYDEALGPVVALAERGQSAGELSGALPAWWIADCLFALLLAALARVGDGRLAPSEIPSLVLTAFWSGAAAGARALDPPPRLVPATRATGTPFARRPRPPSTG